MSQLREQDHLFTVLEKGADGNQPIVIGAVHECLNARLDSLAAIIEKFCEPQVAIVSLTITEKGYCIDPATGETGSDASAHYSRSGESDAAAVSSRYFS
ncbi:D-mannonate oxidoreductase [Klebsiella pneumoniae]|nr:D-mannonate oxidoreductase [Klebsiella pneumoniae]